MVTGTLYNTVKLQALTNKWMQKKDSGNVLSKQEQEKRANWTTDERMVHDYQQQMIEEREKSKGREIANKVTSGGTLSPEEEQYLEKNDPEALKRYRDSKAEKKAYEEKLKNCKTKDEVARLKTETVNGYLSSMKKIEHDPYIPISAKLAKAQEILAKTKNISEAEMKFMQSAEYQKLPTEAEEAIERAEETNAENEKIIAEITDNANDLENENIDEKDISENEMDSNNSIDDFSDDKTDTTDKKKTKVSKNEPEIEIEKSYERIKFNAELELDETNTNVTTSYERNTGKNIDFSV